MIFTFAGQTFEADPSGALFWREAQTLIVADLHIEKGSAFGVRGQFLPPYDSTVTLNKLATVAAHYQSRRILTLGDNVHDAGGWQRLSTDTKIRLQNLAAQYQLDFLFGNHDRLQAPPVGNAIAKLVEAGIRFTHEPQYDDSFAVMAGHLHPCVCIPTAGGHRRVKCFYRADRLLILPAFGTYTGGLDVNDAAFAPLHDDSAELFLCGREIHRLPLGAYLQARTAKAARRHPSERYQKRSAS